MNAADEAARVISLTPGVTSALGGRETLLAVKYDVPMQAVVRSDATGKAQLMLPDDATVSIGPGTEIALAEFSQDPEDENIVLNLATGVARVVTGETSRRNPSALTVNTPQASIGIRGTMVTIATTGDATRIYLTETSGLGVSVRNRDTGETIALRSPGSLITVSPQGMEERAATPAEARQMNAAVRGSTPAATVAAATAAADDSAQATTLAALAGDTPLSPDEITPAVEALDHGLGSELAMNDLLERQQLLAEGDIISTLPPLVPDTPDLPGLDLILAGLWSGSGTDTVYLNNIPPPDPAIAETGLQWNFSFQLQNIPSASWGDYTFTEVGGSPFDTSAYSQILVFTDYDLTIPGLETRYASEGVSAADRATLHQLIQLNAMDLPMYVFVDENNHFTLMGVGQAAGKNVTINPSDHQVISGTFTSTSSGEITYTLDAGTQTGTVHNYAPTGTATITVSHQP